MRPAPGQPRRLFRISRHAGRGFCQFTARLSKPKSARRIIGPGTGRDRAWTGPGPDLDRKGRGGAAL